MFWIGRYVERAEDTAMLFQSQLRMVIEDSQAAEA
ncbi:MAG: alpha-E domain-containing protein, partial [Propionibacteriaceae bacterium]